MLDDAGYLSGDMAQVAVALGCDLERVELTLERVKRFDPSGIFARNLAECLALQLHDKNRLDPAMEAISTRLNRCATRLRIWSPRRPPTLCCRTIELSKC